MDSQLALTPAATGPNTQVEDTLLRAERFLAGVLLRYSDERKNADRGDHRQLIGHLFNLDPDTLVPQEKKAGCRISPDIAKSLAPFTTNGLATAKEMSRAQFAKGLFLVHEAGVCKRWFSIFKLPSAAADARRAVAQDPDNVLARSSLLLTLLALAQEGVSDTRRRLFTGNSSIYGSESLDADMANHITELARQKSDPAAQAVIFGVVTALPRLKTKYTALVDVFNASKAFVEEHAAEPVVLSAQALVAKVIEK